MRTIDRDTMYWAPTNRFELQMPGEAVLDCSHQGACDKDVEYWAPKIQALNPDVSADDIRRELKEYGAWDQDELADEDANWRRLVWVSAGNIQEMD